MSYYQESSASRGISCQAAGRYWPTPVIDRQIEQIVKPVNLPQRWKERALELASAGNNVFDLRLLRRSLEGRRRRVVELYKDGVMDRAEFDREIQIIENQLRTAAPVDVTLAELSIADFERFGDVWDAATPEQRAELLGQMIESLYVDFNTGQALEIVPKPAFRCVFQATAVRTPQPVSATTVR